MPRKPNHRPTPGKTFPFIEQPSPVFDRIALHGMADLPLAIITKCTSKFLRTAGESFRTIVQEDDDDALVGFPIFLGRSKANSERMARIVPPGGRVNTLRIDKSTSGHP